MTEGKKIGIACAIGGAIGTAVALLVAAPFWWLGLLAGFSGGYVSYEFRAVLRAIPQAFWMVVEGIGVIGDWIVAFIREVFKLLFTNPIIHCLLLDVVWIVVLIFIGATCARHIKPELFLVVDAVAVTGLVAFLVFLSAQIIAVEEIIEFGILPYGRIAVGYGKCLLFATGVWVALLTSPVWLPIITIYFLYKFLPILIRLIHSDKRVLCGVDAALGTGVAYVTLARPEMTLAQYALVIAAGAMIGAALGVVNYEVVSKRILHLNGERVAQ